MPWVDPESGETFDECPNCSAMERERRTDRIARAKAEKAVERDTVKARDGALWKRILTHWLTAFPDKKPSAKGIKSARATKTFQRLETGATEADILAAIDGAVKFPYLVYGHRRASGSASDLATDLEDIVSVNRDREFDFLVSAGREGGQ